MILRRADVSVRPLASSSFCRHNKKGLRTPTARRGGPIRTHAHKLFDLVTSRISRKPECDAARRISDYHLPVLDDLTPHVPSGVEVHRMADLA